MTPRFSSRLLWLRLWLSLSICFSLMTLVMSSDKLADQGHATPVIPFMKPVLGPPHPHPRSHLFYLPGDRSCMRDAERECDQILQVCRPGRECEIQCSADHIPNLSPDCVRKHPCANDVEKLCKDHSMATLVSCLRTNAHKLSHHCREMEPCLEHPSEKCPDGKFWVHPATPSIQKLFPFLPQEHPHAQHCECAPDFPCGEHLEHEFCQPCGPGCVRNPLCGVGRHWCIVKSSQCHEPGLTPLYPHDCYGPYPDHPGCSANIVHKEAEMLHSHNYPKSLKDTVLRRCEIQQSLSHSHHTCPPVDIEKVKHELAKFDGRHRRVCSAHASVSSFIHNFFGRLFKSDGPAHLPPQLPHHHDEVVASLHKQESDIRKEHEKLEHIQHQLDDVQRKATDQRFQMSHESRSYLWLGVVPLCLLGVMGVLWQFRSVRRLS